MNTSKENQTRKGSEAKQSALNRLLMEGAEAWRLRPSVVALIVLLPAFIGGVGVLSGLLGKEVYKAFTGEDGIAEYLQVILYIFAFCLAISVFYKQWKQGSRLIALLYLLLCSAFVFMIGEELSWGQRLLGFETTEFFEEANKQEETTFHNLYGIGTGFKWLQLLVGAYGTILPLLLLNRPVPPRYEAYACALVPHYTLITYFLPLFVWRVYRNLFEAPDEYYFAISEFNEVLEIILASGLVFFLVFQLRQRLPGPEPSRAAI